MKGGWVPFAEFCAILKKFNPIWEVKKAARKSSGNPKIRKNGPVICNGYAFVNDDVGRYRYLLRAVFVCLRTHTGGQKTARKRKGRFPGKFLQMKEKGKKL